MTTPLPDPDARLAEAVARAERRRAMLERLGEAAMAVSIEIATRFCESPCTTEPGIDPGKSFAAASRAVRLTPAMEAKAEAHILALCKGDLGRVPPEARREAPEPSEPAPAEPRPDDARRQAVRQAVREAIEREHGDSDAAERLLGRVCAGLLEGEEFEGLLAGAFEDCVAGICEVVGVSPDADPSPLAGEGGPRSGSDEGSTGPLSLSSFLREDSRRVQRDPSSGPSGHLLPQGEKDAMADLDTT